MAEKLVLIDGHSIINRAFYGIPDMTSISGEHTNAVYGFLNIMLKICDEEHPDYLCVAFDVKAPTFRHEMYDAYKGTRKPMPAELHEQVPLLKKVLHTMNITTFEHAGWEADDILGSLAKRAEREGLEVSLISGDRDLLQIASDKIKICIPKTKGGKTETECYYTKDVLEKYQLPPSGIIELKALMGDNADNIPGVPGVGEKTATDLLVQYKTMEGVYEHIDEITKKALHEKLVANKDKAILSKKLATIKTDCDTGLAWNQLKIGNFWNNEAKELFLSLGLKSFMKRFDGVSEAVSSKRIDTDSFKKIDDMSEADSLFDSLEKKNRLAYYFLKDKDGVTSLSISDGSDTYVIIVSGFLLSEDYLEKKMAHLAEDKSRKLITFDAKDSYSALGTDDYANIDDVLIMAYLNNPLKSDYTVQDIASEHLDLQLTGWKDSFPKLAYAEAVMTMPAEYVKYAGTMSYVIYESYELLKDALDKKGMTELYRDIEMPLTTVLYNMEKEGIGVNAAALVSYANELGTRISELEKSIYHKAGIEFNINSPKQLGEVLFEKMGIQGGKKTKTGYSTAADVLEKLAPDHDIVADILEYRGLAKLKSTYAEGLRNCIASDGRIHTTFNQTITATGRISSTEPNLQNIPIRTEQGRLIRKCFVPKEGYRFLDADYSQIELRLLAHMSGDEGLIEAYSMDADIHRITASKVFGIPFDQVTPEKRRDAKAVNFGLVYGISSFGLSQDLGIGRKEAEKYIEDYFITYPGVKRFLDNTVKDAVSSGYVTTMYGRRRPIPELKNSNYMIRSFGERVAMNSPIQGTAADIMKIAMIRVYKALLDSGLDAKILVQVHDELLLEVREDQLEEAKKILHDEMVNAAVLKVKLEVDVHDGDTWYEAK